MNAMYVDTVETKRKYTKLDYMCLTLPRRAKLKEKMEFPT